MAGIKVKFAPTGGLQTNAPITLKSVAVGGGTGRIDRLADVIADTPATEAGSTLVYNPTTDKYEVKLLDIDGGTF